MVGQTLSHYGILEGIGQSGRVKVDLAQGTSLTRKFTLRFQLQLQKFPAQQRFIHGLKSEASLISSTEGAAAQFPPEGTNE